MGLQCLKSVGFHASRLKDAGFSAKQLKKVDQQSLRDDDFCFGLRRRVCRNENELPLLGAGCDARELRDAGFNAKELKVAGFNATQLKKAGFDASQLEIEGLCDE